MAFFDAHLHANGLSSQDLQSMKFFGLKGALLPSRDLIFGSTKDFIRHFEDNILLQTRRLSRIGIRPYVALGIHPARIPWHGIDEILTSIPRLASGGRLVAIGETGLDDGSRREEQVFERHIELALDLRLPLVIHTPEHDKEKVTRRILAILKNQKVPPQAAMIGHADSRNLKIIRTCGYWAGMTINPSRLSAESAVLLVRSFGSEGLIAVSDSGDGVQDIFALPHVAWMLEKQGLSMSISRRFLGQNALNFLGLEKNLLLG